MPGLSQSDCRTRRGSWAVHVICWKMDLKLLVQKCV